ncbi:MAG: hypothetical protein FWC15_02720 [Fibromonadales bacterium]|nr:hypothetical protein [Fibromonadales bacterium]
MKKLLILAVLVLMACAGPKQSQETEIKKDVKKDIKKETKKEAAKDTKKESQATLKKMPNKSEKKPLTIAEKCNKINAAHEFSAEDMVAPVESSYDDQENVHEDCSCIEIITCDGLDICYTFKCSKSGIVEVFK